MDYRTALPKVGAEMLKVDDVTGYTEEGKSADLLVLDGNPLKTSGHLRGEYEGDHEGKGVFVKRH